MKVQSNIQFSEEPQNWQKPGMWVIFYNQKDNGEQPEGQKGSRYEADMIIVDAIDAETIAAAKELNVRHPEQMQRIIDGIE